MLPQVPSKGLDADGHYIWYIIYLTRTNPIHTFASLLTHPNARVACFDAARQPPGEDRSTVLRAPWHSKTELSHPKPVRKRRGTGDLYEAITCDTRFWISEWVIQREGHGQIPRPALGGRCKESPIVSSIWTWNHTAKRDKDAHP